MPGAAGKLGLALAGLVLFALLSLSVGPGDFTIAEVFAWLAGSAGDAKADSILGSLRVPRILLALLVGGSLGCAGALTQGLFRNPLASPSVLGLPTGAATFVVAGFAFGLDAKALWVTPLLAFTGAFVMLLVLFALTAGRRDATMLLLSGVALGALMGAITIQSFNDTPELASRPYDTKREGFVPSHGAGALVIEELDHALERGATIYAEILGVTATADGKVVSQLVSQRLKKG